MHIATVEEVEVTISKVKYDGNFRDRSEGRKNLEAISLKIERSLLCHV